MAEVFFPFKLGASERKITTVLIVVVLAATVLPLAGAVVAYFTTGQPVAIVAAVAIFVSLVPVVFLPGYAPAGAVVTPEELRIVKRKRGPVVLPAAQIVSLEPIDASTLRGCIRTFGCGGLFGSWGRFRCKALGAFRGYITDAKSLVLIHTASEGLFVISPESPQEFVARAAEVLKLPASRAAH